MEKQNARNADLSRLADARLAAVPTPQETRADDVESLADWQLALVGGGDNIPTW